MNRETTHWHNWDDKLIELFLFSIHAEEGDTTQPEVKRKLDMRSDSDESLLSSAITEISLKPFSVKGNCRTVITEWLFLRYSVCLDYR